MERHSKSSLTTPYIVLFGALLLLANIALGVLLLWQSSSVIQSLIRKSMLNVSNTAAELVDGDSLGAFTAADVGSASYNKILRDLAAFQNHSDVEFIYAVRRTGEDEFIFTVDPDPVDPGMFGEEVLVTAGMRQAAGASPPWTTPPPRTGGAIFTARSAPCLTLAGTWPESSG